MPTYEFRCPEGHDFEKFYRSIGSAEAQAACPVCGKLSERRMSAAGFAFKGSGFYLTDYGKNAHRESAPAEAGAAAAASEAKDAAPAKGESGSVEAKADAKSDAAKVPATPSSEKSDTKKKEPVTKAADPKPATPKKASGGE